LWFINKQLYDVRNNFISMELKYFFTICARQWGPAALKTPSFHWIAQSSMFGRRRKRLCWRYNRL